MSDPLSSDNPSTDAPPEAATTADSADAESQEESVLPGDSEVDEDTASDPTPEAAPSPAKSATPTLAPATPRASYGPPTASGVAEKPASDPVDVPQTKAPYRRRKRRAAEPVVGPPRVPLAERPSVDFILRYGVVGLLFLAPLLIGGVHFETGFGLGLGATLLGGFALVVHRRSLPRFGLVGIAFALWAFATAIQLVPLPLDLLAVLSPEAAARNREAYSLLGESAGWAPLSLSPGRTAVGLWPILGFAGMYVATFLHFRTSERFAWLLPRVVGAGLIFIAAAGVQTGFFEGSILGLYETASTGHGRLSTTLINPNHAGAFLGAVALVTFGVGVAAAEGARRFTYIILYLILSVAMFLTMSRGAMLAWGLCHLPLLFVFRAGGISKRAIGAAVVVVMLAALTAGVIVGGHELDTTVKEMAAGAEVISSIVVEGDDTWADAGQAEGEASCAPGGKADSWRTIPQTPQRHEKVEIYGDLAPMMWDFATFGIGREAFGEVYPRYETEPSIGSFSHVENEYIELVLEYGLPFAILFLGLVGVAVIAMFSRTDWRSVERPLVAGALAAIVFIALQNVFDFNMRFPGLGFLLAVLLGASAGRAARYANAARTRKERKPHGWLLLVQKVGAMGLVGALVASVAIGVFSLPAAAKSAEEADIAALREAVIALEAEGPDDPEAARADLIAIARPALLARPANSYLRFLVTVGLLRSGAGGMDAAYPWLEATIEQRPKDHRVHLLMGRVLAARGELAAAAAAFSTAATIDRRPSVAVYRSVADSITEMDHLEASLSPDPRDWVALGNALNAKRRFADAMELGERLRLHAPDRFEPIDIVLQSYLRIGMPEAAVGLLDDLDERIEDTPLIFHRRVAVARALKQWSEVDALLAEGAERYPKDASILFSRGEFLMGVGRSLYLDETDWIAALEPLFETLRPLALAKPVTRYRFHTLRGRYLWARGQVRPSLVAYEAAYDARPKAVPALLGIVRAAMTLGTLHKVEAAIEELVPLRSPEAIVTMRKALEVRRIELTKRGFSASQK